MTTKARRFYRSNLETIVWDPDNNKPLADFGKGHFTTEDPRVAQRLVELGYPEIPLDAKRPPDILVNKPTHVIEGDVPVMGQNQAPIAVEKNVERRETVVDDRPQAPATPAEAQPAADAPKKPKVKKEKAKQAAKKPAPARTRKRTA